MRRRIFRVLSLIIAILSFSTFFACTEEVHEHIFYKKDVEQKYLAQEANCTEKSKYYYSCDCGEHGTETFDVGESLGHSYENYVCTICEEEQCSEGLAFLFDYATGGYAVKGIGECKDSEIIIPLVYNDKPVTAIYQDAFYFENFTSIVIKGNVIKIYDNAFWSCKNLENVVLPSSLTTINKNAFTNCESLEKIVIPSSVTTVEKNAFTCCKNLTIYCEIASKPSGWKNEWNYNNSNNPPIWNYRTN